MSEIIAFIPRFNTPAENLADFIDRCRKLTRYEEQGGFAVDEWKTETLKRPMAMRFSVYDGGKGPKEFTPLPEPFSLIAKGYIRYLQRDKETSAINTSMIALQVVYDAVKNENGHADILQINGHTQKEAARIINERYPGSDARYRYGRRLIQFYDLLKKQKIAPKLPVWKNAWLRPKEKINRTDKAAQKFQEEKMPTIHQMTSLADCFHLAEDCQDLYWSSKSLLLMFAPNRAGELEDLTINCIGEEDGHYFVGWHGEKGFGATRKWIPKLLVEDVKEAVARLTEISRPAREAAKFAFDNPGKFYRHSGCITPPDFPDDKPLDVLQFAAAIQLDGAASYVEKRGCHPNSGEAWNYFSSTKWIQNLLEDGPITYNALAKFVNNKYKGKNWPNLGKTGRPIWESLTLVRKNEFHKDFNAKEFSWRIPSVSEMNSQLGPRDMKNAPPTMFQRLGLKDEDGSEIEMTTHMPRRWLSTVAERGGMDQWQLAQWAGRRRMRDNKSYDGRTKDEKIAMAAKLMVRTEAPTALEAVKANLPVSYESLGINRIGVAHITEYGMCVHDYSMSPCSKGGECMTCKEHVCIKGMPKTLERIKEYEARVRTQFEKA